MRILKKNIFVYIHICVYVTESLCCVPETKCCKPTVIFFLKRYMYLSVHSSTVYSRQGREYMAHSCGYQKEGDINNSIFMVASCWCMTETNTTS